MVTNAETTNPAAAISPPGLRTGWRSGPKPKRRPANGYAGKFSTPYCIAAGFTRGNVGLSDFSDSAVRDPAVLALAAKVRYRIDPSNPYPKNFTGHIRATLRDGSAVEERQPYMRGGAQEPLSDDEITRKFVDNAVYGGWTRDQALGFAAECAGLFEADRPSLFLSSRR